MWRCFGLFALSACACGPSELGLGLPEGAGMISGLLGIRPSEAGARYEDLYAIDLRTRPGLTGVRPLEAGPKAPALTLDLLLFACDLPSLGLDPGAVAISLADGIEPPPTRCVFEVELQHEYDEVQWRAVDNASAAARDLRYSSREPSCPRDEMLHRCPTP